MSSDTTIKCNKKGITMKYYITDDNFNVLSVHPDRESAKAVWDVSWKAGVDVYLENEENHLKNIEWAKAYKQRAIERKKRREEKAVAESLEQIKNNHELFESAEDKAIKEMEKDYKEIDNLVKEDLERKEIEKVTDDLWKDMSKDIMVKFNEDDVKPMSFYFEEAAQREAIEDNINKPTEGCDDCLWIIKETDGDVTVCNECLEERNNK